MRLTDLYVPTSKSLALSWANSDGMQTIYTGEANTITLTLTNDLGSTLVINTGPVPSEGNVAAGIYLSFGALLDASQIAAIDVSAGWIAQATQQQGTTVLALLQSSASTVGNGDALELTLSNVSSTAPVPTTGPVYAYLIGATYEDGAQLPLTQAPNVMVTVEQPQVPSQADLELVVGFAGSNVVLTSASGDSANTLLLYVTNPGKRPLVPDGVPAWNGNTPTFVLTFVFSGAGEALTTIDQGTLMTVDVRTPLGLAWDDAYQNLDDGYPSWTLQPSENGGGVVLGAGDRATVAFEIENIVTQLRPGLTYAYLAYSNIPGYNDGFFAIEIVKLDPVTITSFAPGQASAPDAVGGVSVPLNFEVANATSVTISNTGYTGAAVQAPLNDSVAVYASTTTTYTLVAANAITGQIETSSVVVDVPPVHLVPTGTILMWSGAADAVPAGWALCDGTNGTPDLRNRFVVGTDGVDGPPIASTGGESMHTHSVAASAAGEHTHAWPAGWWINKFQGSNHGGYWTPLCNQAGQNGDGGDPSQWPLQDAGTHTHTITTLVTETLPPWVALCYIMKVT